MLAKQKPLPVYERSRLFKQTMWKRIVGKRLAGTSGAKQWIEKEKRLPPVMDEKVKRGE